MRTLVEFSRVFNMDPDDTQLKETVWNAMGSGSKEIASAAQLDDEEKKFDDLYTHIVKRYKLKHNPLDVKAIGRSRGSNDFDISLVK